MRVSLIAITFLITASVSAASAQPERKPSKQDIAEARKHFAAAEAAKQRGDWDAAADQYLAAYARFPDPEFYFNVGEVYRRKGDPERALQYYMKYLEQDADGRGSAAARTAVAEINRALERKRAEEAERKRQEARPVPAPVPPPRPTPAEEEEEGDDDEEPVQLHPARRGRTLRIAGLASGGAGVVALGVAAVFGVKARRIASEAAGWDSFDPDRYAAGQAAERNFFIATGIGTAALIGGGVLYYLGHRADRRTMESGLALTPVASPDGLAVVAAGRF